MTIGIRLMRGRDAFERLSKSFDSLNPQMAARRKARLAKAEKANVSKTAKGNRDYSRLNKALDDLVEVIGPSNSQSPDPATEMIEKADPVSLGDAIGDESLGTQSGRMAKSVDEVALYGGFASQGTIEKAETKARGAGVKKADKPKREEIDPLRMMI